jgi:drug/metabolite transporter (DMT)-like permease
MSGRRDERRHLGDRRGIRFGLFQSINRQAVRGVDVWQSTFMQLAVSSVVLLLPTLVTEDLGDLRSASVVALAAFLAAGLVHFLIGWTLINASQKRSEPPAPARCSRPPRCSAPCWRP